MNLLFDLDGTLTDPFMGITKCISYALEMLGRQSPTRKSLRWCIGPPLKNSLAKLLASDDETLADKALSLYRERYGTIGLFENKVYECIYEVLETLLEKGHDLYVATSKPEIYAERIVRHFSLKRYFKNIYGSELDGTRNDKTNLISYILKNESISSSDTFMIGDREHDMIGAKANGIFGIGVLWGYGTKKELETSGAQTCIRHPQELIVAFD
ncbi:MAG: HAD-IA family hydrolase [Desulfobacteraceae bacterium]